MRMRFVARGMVQGVNFRAATLREAVARGLRGRVWNRDDGAVEVIAEGDAPQLEDFGRWLERGPRSARVEQVARTALGGADRYTDFDIAWRAPE